MTEHTEQDKVIRHECELDAAPETVWRAVTVPEFLEQWIGSPPATSPQGPATEEDKPSYRLIEATPCTQVRFAWRDNEADHLNSVVTINLAPAPDGGTYFSLTHRTGKIPMVAANQNGISMRAAA